MGKFATKPQKKKGMKGFVVLLSVLLILLTAVVAASVWVAASYHIVAGKFYPKDVAVLDLREEEIKPGHFEKVREKMPGCEILWNIPFQGGTVPNDTEEVTVTALTEKDVALLDYAEGLKTVRAEGCMDYEALELLRQRRPELDVQYGVMFSSGSYSWDVEELILHSVSEEDIHLLKHLPNLKLVALEAGNYDSHLVEALRGSVRNAGLSFGVILNGNICTDTTEEVRLENAADGDLQMLSYISGLKTLHLTNPQADPRQVCTLGEQLPGVAVSWEVSVGDQIFDSQTTAVDLTGVEVTDLAEVEQKMAYLPQLESVTFGVCGMDEAAWGNSRSKLQASPIQNEDMAAYRDRVREDYKVVWTVRLGPNIALRTDADNFMPNHFGVGQLPDNYAYNLRYCEEMVCLDVGHMTLTDISFVEYMPNLKYLILAWTEVQYIEPIRTCKNLVFLELDNSCIRDISPLVDCTALEDLNLGRTYCDITPILGMSWLKNVYMIRRGGGGLVGQAIPTARVVTTTDETAATVGYGWRRLPNYYAMRDCLNMPYMN